MNQSNNDRIELLKHMPELESVGIRIRRQPNDYAEGAVRLDQIDSLYWDCTSGGINIPFSHSMICTYVWCTDIEDGGVSHTCRHGPAPHRIKVCVMKKTNDTRIYRVLKMIADSEFDLNIAERIIRTGRKNGRLDRGQLGAVDILQINPVNTTTLEKAS